MALIIYPTADYDSFVSVANADDYISSLTVYSADWTALSTDDKERYLRIALRTIVSGIDTDTYPLPDPMLTCAAEAQSLIAIHDLVNGLSTSKETSTGAIRRNKVGSIEQEFFEGKFKHKSRIPAIAKACLESLDFDTNILYGVTQTTLGRS